MPSTVPTRGHGHAWQLAREIERQIDEGKYSPGARLPSYRDWMEEYDLTSGVVSYAMNILSEQGLVERRHGSGVYVRSTKTRSQATQAGLVALVVPDIESGLYLSIQAGMERAAQADRAQLITMTTGCNAAQQADVLLQLIDRDVAGIALVPPYENLHAYQLRHLHRANVPLVLLHRAVPDVPSPAIEIPFAEVGRRAANEIVARGHRRVGIFLGLQTFAAEQYLAGFREALSKHGLALDDDWIIWSESVLITPEDFVRHSRRVESTMERIRDDRQRPTALFASYDRLAGMVYFEALRKGFRIAEDLSIVAFGGNRLSTAIGPRLASVIADENETGAKAYELLAAMQRGDRPIESDERLTMAISFEPGETLGPPRVI